jgi:hypothetical protein
MHKTAAGERRRGLLKKASELEREAKFLAKGKKPILATETHEEAKKLKTQAGALKTRARLEDLTVRVAEKVKTTKKGSKSYTYWRLLERRRKGAQRPPRKHQEAFSGGGQTEGQGDEGGLSGEGDDIIVVGGLRWACMSLRSSGHRCRN